jgi:hypothetical protein
MMEFVIRATLKKPELAVRHAHDNDKYCAPVELKYKGKVYDRFKTVSPVSHKGTNVMASYPAKKC